MKFFPRLFCDGKICCSAIFLYGLVFCGIVMSAGSRADDHFFDSAKTNANDEIRREAISVDYLVENGSEMTFAEILNLPHQAWSRKNWTSASYGFAAAPHWFKSDPFKIGAGNRKILLEVAYPLLDQIDFYVRVNDQSPWKYWILGDKLPFHDRPYIARTFVVPVFVKAGDVVEVIARVNTSGSMRYPLFAWQPKDFESEEHQTLLTNGVYLGLMGGVCLTNLIIFAIIRDKIYLYYGAWILTTALFTTSYNGVAFQYLWPGSNVWNDWCRISFMIVASGLFTSFTMAFVYQPGSKSRSASVHFLPTLLAFAVAGGASFVSFALAVKISLFIQLAGTIYCMGLASVQARQGHVPAKIFLVAFSGVLIGAALHVLDVAGVMRYLQASINFEVAPQIGSAVAVLLFSLALANRLQEERRHQAAAAEMRLAHETLASAMLVEQERAKASLEINDRLRIEAERRDREKSRFLAEAVHDLRQPLQAIGNALDPIEGAIKTNSTENALALVDMATRAAATMRAQLSTILDLSRLDSGSVKADISDFDLAALIRETADQSRSLAHSHRTELILDFEPDKRIFVRSDRHFVQRILTNLIANGIKYRSETGGKSPFVRVRLAEERQGVHLSVQDNGIGIPKEFLKNGIIFRPFFQVNNRPAFGDKGVGLGLSIVSAMLSLLIDHKLTISSDVGVGSSFKLQLPASEFTPVFEAVASADFAAAEVEAARGKYVILIEDDLLVLQTMAAVLKVHGVLYEAWGSLEEMRIQLPSIERAPDVLLTDYRLPNEHTALDAMSLMEDYWPDVPVIILSGEALRAGLELEGRDVSLCYKPIAPLDLLRHIAASASKRGPTSTFGTL